MLKQKITLLVSVLLPVLLFSSEADSSYFPLSLGNSWEFSSDFGLQTEMILDTATINNNLYYGLSLDSSHTLYWLRESAGQVFCLEPNNIHEFLLFDFNMQPGDSIILPAGFGCSFGVKIHLKGKDDTIITPTDTFYNCYHFKHWPTCFDAGIFDSWFAKGKGKVKYIADNIAGAKTYLLNNYAVTTEIEKEFDNSKANTFNVYQNYPNPFNSSTVINYNLTRDAKVTLKIYDISGRKIKTLVEQEQKPGQYKVVFNAEGLSSGIYIYKLNANGYEQNRKMILIR